MHANIARGSFANEQDNAYPPSQHDEKVQPVPRVGQVRALAVGAHGHDLDGHLDGEEGEDEVVEELQRGRNSKHEKRQGP